MTDYRKKLIEVSLPLEAINEGSKPETENPFLKGHPRALHNWWARTPLSVCRAIVFSQIVNDPEDNLRREELLSLVGRLARWDALRDQALISEARRLIEDSAGSELNFFDPFAGRGSIPLEALRLGLGVTSSDLNPVAVFIDKILLDIVPRFANRSPVRPHQEDRLFSRDWQGAEGLAEDVRFYGLWMRDEAEKSLGNLYPKVKLPAADGAAEVVPSVWLWARIVKCPNPACTAEIPLARSFKLSKKKGRKAWIEPKVDPGDRALSFSVRSGEGAPPKGTVDRKGARCFNCGEPVGFKYIRDQAQHGRMSARLMAIIAEGNRRRIYLTPSSEQEAAAEVADSQWRPETDLPAKALGFRVQQYGMTKHADLFTRRQLVALTTLCDMVGDVGKKVEADAVRAGMADDGIGIEEGGIGARAYADAIASVCACAVSRASDYWNSLATWNTTNENVRNLFQRQAIPMAWDFAEAEPLQSKLGFATAVSWVLDALSNLPTNVLPARVLQLDVTSEAPKFSSPPVVSTDPPYYDNIGYSDISDFFYVWLRRALANVYPTLFATLLTPKQAELIATPYRHEGSPEAAKKFFRENFEKAFETLRATAHPEIPITVYYAFKQAEEAADEDENAVSTGWETMLEGLLGAGLSITGTWPVRTTKKARSVARGTNALASAVVLVCRPRKRKAHRTTRREFLATLKRELPNAVRTLQSSSIAPVDLAQASIGPGMAVFSRYGEVLEADGTPMTVRTALALINQTLGEVLSEQEGDFDRDTRWALAWFAQHEMEGAPYGEADVLARAKNVGVDGLVESGIVQSKAGTVRLLKRDELASDWDPATDERITVWEVAQYLIARLLTGGEAAAAELLHAVGPMGDTARELAYRLYQVCEQKGWAQEAVAYNSLVVAWPVIAQLAGKVDTTRVEPQTRLFE